MEGLPALVVTAFLLFTLVGNEVTHGYLAELSGLGHHHALDHGGIHCVDHDDPEMGPEHVRHVHGEGPGAHGGPAHEDCPGAHGDENETAVGGRTA